MEIYKDASIGVSPVARSEAGKMIRSLKCLLLLEGYRGKPGVDLDQLETMLCRLSTLLLDLPEITELDMNPVVYDNAERISMCWIEGYG